MKPKSIAPRDYLVHPELFGRPGDQAWVQPRTPDDFAGMRAAEMQHYLSLAIVSAIRDRGVTSGWVEGRADLATGRLSKMLRGHAHMALRDIQALEGVLGPVLLDLRFQRSPIENPALRERFDRDAERWGHDL